MSNYLLYSNATSTTGKALAEALKAKSINVVGTTKDPGKAEVLFRWGSLLALAQNPKKVYNSKRAISLASDKSEALKTFQSHGINIPETFDSADKVTLFPVLGRKTHHIAGNDIVLCLQRKDLEGAIAAGCTHFT